MLFSIYCYRKCCCGVVIFESKFYTNNQYVIRIKQLTFWKYLHLGNM